MAAMLSPPAPQPEEAGVPAADRPHFHLAPHDGWLNDPNAPLYYRGRYHMFYQHVEAGCEWQWGLVWGHAVSEDLVRWRHLPPALRPTPGGADADGCWSGCCAVSAEGVPTILYTGVRLRSGASRLPPPPPGQDLGLLWIESQLAAAPEDPGNDLLLRWRKLPQPAVALPQPGMALTGWRDPFVYLGAQPAAAGGGGLAAGEGQLPEQQHGQLGQQGRYRMLLGSGVKPAGGAAGGGALLGYRSASLAEGWQYTGPVCSTADLAAAAAAELAGGPASSGGSGCSASAAAGVELGEVWECPLLVPLTLTLSETTGGSDGSADVSSGGDSGGEGQRPQRWLLAVSPYPCKPPHTPSNPVLYWISGLSEDGSRFELAGASGPHRLDHGDVLYAPNACRDAKGSVLLWAWLQERRTPGTAATYAGCLSVPRRLSLSPDGRRLLQRPAPQLSLLRRCFSSHAGGGDGSSDGNGDGSAADPPAAAFGSPGGGGGGGEGGPAAAVAPGFSARGGWYAEEVEVAEGQLLAVEGVAGPQLDLELCFRRGTASAAGLLILSHEAGTQGNALLTYTWATNALGVTFGVPSPSAASSVGGGSGISFGAAPAAPELHLPAPPAFSSPRQQPPSPPSPSASGAANAFEASPPGSPAAAAVAAPAAAVVEAQLAALAEPLPQAAEAEAAAAAASPARQLGGPLTAPAADAQGRVRLRVLLDGSALEVFTGSGETLSTRLYRGSPPPVAAAVASGVAGSGGADGGAWACASGVAVVSLGGAAVLESGAAWEMASCWVPEGAGEEQAPEAP